MNRSFRLLAISLAAVLAMAALLAGCDGGGATSDRQVPNQSTSSEEGLTDKPVLYLYPTQPTDISVKLDFDGRLTTTYPAYNGGWNVRAYPDGHLINKADGQEYSYLFWEGFANHPDWDMSHGYCVTGADTAAFLRQALSKLGLMPPEYNEFIVYWLPQMQGSPYNLITFQWAQYEKVAPLTISPPPDSTLRVFMAFSPLDHPVSIAVPAARPAFVRRGFTAVEGGGTETQFNP